MKKNTTIHPALSDYLNSGAKGNLTYLEYAELIASRLADGKNTGNETNPKYLEYSKINLQRMKRWEKKATLTDEMKEALERIEPQTWLVLTEGWCGDSAQNIPFMKRMAEFSNGKIKLVMLIRDDYPEVIDAYLTNGGRSIPKLVSFNDDHEELFTWGPRPQPVQKMVTDYKKLPDPKPDYGELQLNMQKWYNADKGQVFQQEIINVLS